MRTTLILAAAVLLTAGTALGQAAPRNATVVAAPPTGTGGAAGTTIVETPPPNFSGTVTVHTFEQAATPFNKTMSGPQGSGALTLLGNSPFAEARPALIVTTPLAAGARQEWNEDLAVMDKLVRDAIGGRPDGAMGIYVDGTRGATPRYIEGCGVVIEASVSFPLAGQAKPAESTNVPPSPTSPWDRAKDQLQHRGTFTLKNSSSNATAVLMTLETYDPARVEALKKALIAALVEGRHFRRLSANESVIITVTGAPNEHGEPSRMTVTAKKSDMDAAAESPAAAEAFEGKVKSLVE